MSCPRGQLRPALSEPCHVPGYGREVPNLGLYEKPQCLNLDTWFSEQVNKSTRHLWVKQNSSSGLVCGVVCFLGGLGHH